YYLNEQMKAIQKELGDGDEGHNEVEELVHLSHAQFNDGGLRLWAKNLGRRQAELVGGGQGHGAAAQEVLEQRLDQITLPD
ncbi:hypothetical protein SB756_33135, partial [Pseudomonas sp. SIMBA_068]